MKKQFDKKRWNLQGLKLGNNIWLKAKKISNQINFQRSQTKKDINSLQSQKTLVREHFS